MTPRRAAFLDRDGVVNVDHGYTVRIEDFAFVAGALEASRALADAGYVLVVVTNQSGIGRGLYSIEEFNTLNDWMRVQFAAAGAPLAGVYFCPHHPTDAQGEYLRACNCRKPAPGMLLDAARELNLDLSRSVLFGDRAGDLEAARAAGVPERILLGTNGNTEPAADVPAPLATARFRSLSDAVDKLLKASGAEAGIREAGASRRRSGGALASARLLSGLISPETKPDPDFCEPDPDFCAKVVAQENLSARVAQLPRPIVFTNGVFDILHRGHVTYLARARALGASLVVALNSDASVKRLGKGDDRPINTQDDRAAVLAALESVSLVTIFDEQVPLPALDVVRPEVYVKGGDYDMNTIAEAVRARSWGARTVAIPFEHERSTTALLRRVRGV